MTKTSYFHDFINETKPILFPPKMVDTSKTYQPKLVWRWLYLVLAWLVVSVILGFYGELLVPIVPDQGFYREFIMCAGQVVFQTLLIGHLTQGRLMDYLGNMMTVSLIGSIILLPVLFFAWLTAWVAPWFYVGCFLVVVLIIILIHKNRVQGLGMPWVITVSWIVYRLLLLAVIYGIM